jgi:uncharacterized protein YjdB
MKRIKRAIAILLAFSLLTTLATSQFASASSSDLQVTTIEYYDSTATGAPTYLLRVNFNYDFGITWATILTNKAVTDYIKINGTKLSDLIAADSGIFVQTDNRTPASTKTLDIHIPKTNAIFKNVISAVDGDVVEFMEGLTSPKGDTIGSSVGYQFFVRTSQAYFTNPLISIALNKATTSIVAGLTETLTVTYKPTNTADSKTVVWTTSDATKATVVDGVVTAVAAGTATITATCNGKTATCAVTVAATSIPLTAIALNKATTSIFVGRPDTLTTDTLTPETLTVTYTPANTTDSKTVVWTTSDATKATVANGVVTAVALGTATITATCNGKTATCAVTVAQVNSSDLQVTRIAYTDAGALPTLYYRLQAVFNYDFAAAWSSIITDKAVTDYIKINGTKLSDLIAEAAAAGKPMIVQTDSRTTDSKKILDIYIPKTNAIFKNVISAVDGDVVEFMEGLISPTGNMIGSSVGNQFLVRTSSTGFTITPLTSIALNKATTSIVAGQTETLTATYNPTDTTDSKETTWTSSDPTKATVANGVVTAVAAGTATITATCNEKTATCVVTVTAATTSKPLTAIALNKATTSIVAGQTDILTVTYTPADTTDSKTVVWTTSDATKATVANDVVTAVAAGTATITATCNGKTATCAVTVTQVNSSDLQVTKIGYSDAIGTGVPTYRLQVFFNKDFGIAWTTIPTDKAVTDYIKINGTKLSDLIAADSGIFVQTDNRTPASTQILDIYIPKTNAIFKNVISAVDGDVVEFMEGLISPKGDMIGSSVGNQIFVRTSQDYFTIVTITPLTSIVLNKATTSIVAGQTETLTVTYTPADTTDSKTIVWTTSDATKATVANGVVTAVAAGTATITATCNGKTATCAVTVTAATTKPLTSISLNKTTTSIVAGQTETLTVTYNPADTTDSKTATWTTSDATIATVENGVVTAVAAGTATITATSNGKTTTSVVTVTASGSSSDVNSSSTVSSTTSSDGSPTTSTNNGNNPKTGGSGLLVIVFASIASASCLVFIRGKKRSRLI